jgi:rare lipoprotein A
LLITGKTTVNNSFMNVKSAMVTGKKRVHACLLAIMLLGCMGAVAQTDTPKVAKKGVSKVLYGTASFYANSFNGRKTANGEIFSQAKLTCACNVLPLGTWLKVTNMRNGKSVIVKVNDRMHPKMRRIVDLTRSAAQKIGFVSSGLTRVKVEVLGKNYR